jgi:hypothetical protein
MKNKLFLSKSILFSLGFILIININSCSLKEIDTVDISGEWTFKIDSLDQGIKEEWFKGEFNEKVNLPGSMSTNGKGNEVSLHTKWTGSIFDSSYFFQPEYARYREPGNIKVPFWLQPLHHYVGAAWYKKTVDIPKNWDNKSIELFLERCHWETHVWIDDVYIGSENLLGSPHKYDLTDILTPGRHTITIRVDNSIQDVNVGINSHSISDHTQTNWNGIVGDISLRKKERIHIDQIKIHPDVKGKKAWVTVVFKNQADQASEVEVSMSAVAHNSNTSQRVSPHKATLRLEKGLTEHRFEYRMGENPLLWDEFDPNLYKLNISLSDPKGREIDTRETIFGMREIEVKGQHIFINGRRIFLRGTLECAIFPRTGFPPTDKKEWERIYTIIKAHGLNHMRFHSWCPPEAAFAAADEMGIYLQAENSSWANWGTSLGDSLPVDQFLYKEAEHNLNNYGNHPSFIMMASGNEPGGENQVDYLSRYVSYWKVRDSSRLHTSGTGWPPIPVNDFHVVSEPRIQLWGAGLKSIINSEPPNTMFDFEGIINDYDLPVISHEIGQWCVYPDFKEIDKYDGVLRAKNFEIFRETLEENNMLHLADSFLLASGKLQVLCYKADIEAALRTKGQAGFQLLDLHDFPGQGTALVGVLDPFWDEKGYVTAAEYNRFCSETVPLVRLPKRVYVNDETLKATAEIAHYGKEIILNPDITWTLSDTEGNTVKEGKFQVDEIPIGNGTIIGSIEAELSKINEPEKLVLAIKIGRHENSWDIWVYPSAQQRTTVNKDDIKVVQQLDQKTAEFLQNGGKVLLTVKKGSIKNEKGGDVAVGFSSIFWNTAWTNGQAPHTLGILCNPGHPAFKAFPTEYHSNWQWWDAMTHSDAIILSDFDKGLRPIVRIIDDWVTNRPLGLIFDVKVGKGKLLISGIDLLSAAESRPEARQLLHSLIDYMKSDRFDPEISARIETVESLF